jgi:hypothetical protein
MPDAFGELLFYYSLQIILRNCVVPGNVQVVYLPARCRQLLTYSVRQQGVRRRLPALKNSSIGAIIAWSTGQLRLVKVRTGVKKATG